MASLSLIRPCLVAIVAAIALPLSAQTTAQQSADQLRARYEAHSGDFDYLLGEWQFTAVSRQYGNMRGFWTAARLGEGAEIFDEYRVVGDSGETYYVTNTLRAYNANLDQWELVSTERGTGLQNLGTAHRVGNEMHIEQKFGVGTPDAALMRIRYYDIGPEHFSWVGDRSTDGGRTWISGSLRIEATRIGPARTMEPLAPARKPANAGP